MKYLIDTNVLISAFVFGGAPRRLLLKLLGMGETVYISKFVDDEFRAKLMEKWPGKADRVYALYRQLSFNFCTSTTERFGTLRDVKDIPVLSDAIYHDVDVIVSGDKDFLEAQLEKPMVFAPGELLEFLTSRESNR